MSHEGNAPEDGDAPAVASTMLCTGCGKPLPEDRVFARFEYIVRKSTPGKGTYSETVGPAVTHPDHRLAAGGLAYDEIPRVGWPTCQPAG